VETSVDEEETPLRGQNMVADLAAQPDVVARLVARAPEVGQAVRACAPSPPAGIVLAGSEASRYAAEYGRCLLACVTRRPVWVSDPAVPRCYGVRTELAGHLAIGVSRTGRSPDTLQTLERARAGGAATLAVTNDPTSPLAEVADAVVLLEAGVERAAVATRTFTAELTALALVAQALGRVPWQAGDWRHVVEALEDVVTTRRFTRELAVETLASDTFIGLGHGMLFPAVGEACAAITATTGMVTTAYTPTDLRIGPGDGRRHTLDVVCMAAPGPCLDEIAEGARWLASHGARVWAVTDSPERIPDAAGVVPVPTGLPEALAPIVSVVRGQQLAHDLAFARHLDPDVRRGLAFAVRSADD
jgi:glucosamine--fructose-6-phosphate aminotransferase (isomerizing)